MDSKAYTLRDKENDDLMDERDPTEGNKEFDLLSRYNDNNDPSIYQKYHPIEERSEMNSVYSRDMSEAQK